MDNAGLSDLIGRAMAWRDADPDPRTRRELDLLIERCTSGGPSNRGSEMDLRKRFSGSLRFGTAGLRGPLGAGPNRMNRAVVIRAAAGLAAFLAGRIEARPDQPGDQLAPRVMVGYDARRDSDVFARDTCAVLVAAGAAPALLPAPLPTPVLAFAVRRFGADAGVMVTASHNPASDNGYKVYLGGRVGRGEGQGAQIVPPQDLEIAEQIEAAPSAIDVPMAIQGWHRLTPSVLNDYLSAIMTVLDPAGPRDIDVVITPLHGVGGDTALKAFSLAGFPVPHIVPEQARPDPAFPTVSFPNPEEAGAMDLAIASARARGADLVIANDPDADRCAVAVPVNGAGGWRRLSGDEVGALLGEYLLERTDSSDRAAGPRTVASSLVSSQLLSRIAAAHGVRHVQTLTGFKWLTRVPDLTYAYEEALGYCVAPDVVRDKDGISAALLVTELAARLKAEGRTLLDALDDLARVHGLHATGQFSVRVDDLAEAGPLLNRLAAEPPLRLGAHQVISAQNLSDGVDQLPATPGLCYRTAGHGRVIVRPSGTEPKLKVYLEVVVAVPPGPRGLTRAHELATGSLAGLRAGIIAALGVPPDSVS